MPRRDRSFFGGRLSRAVVGRRDQGEDGAEGLRDLNRSIFTKSLKRYSFYLSNACFLMTRQESATAGLRSYCKYFIGVTSEAQN